MSDQTYDEQGLRFDYPPDWVLEETEDGAVRTVAVQAPDGAGFAVIQTDDSRPDPAEIADAALQAMRDDYPDLESRPILETINDHAATGHDLEFVSLDVTNSASIRCFRTPTRTILALGQWSDLDGEETAQQVLAVVRSIEESE
ncbi:hypothetical protein [Planctomyces sp. SH-PL62]|uniref:hypothetical protein n=1 Tax=Planctomyces sp. SH-PL62 TaxID=1636152 RepID=UPI00078DC5E6|nr:hypothetical protein [Planctomyces sp. SH-PL62]AMV35906.1 hypothetical protein VT85_00580 [Planctomyces sp. SH-PL62]